MRGLRCSAHLYLRMYSIYPHCIQILKNSNWFLFFRFITTFVVVIECVESDRFELIKLYNWKVNDNLILERMNENTHQNWPWQIYIYTYIRDEINVWLFNRHINICEIGKLHGECIHCITLNCIAFHFRFVIEYKSMTMNKTTHQLQCVCAISVCDWNWVRYFAHTLKSPYGHFCYVVVYFLRFFFLFCFVYWKTTICLSIVNIYWAHLNIKCILNDCVHFNWYYWLFIATIRLTISDIWVYRGEQKTHRLNRFCIVAQTIIDYEIQTNCF